MMVLYPENLGEGGGKNLKRLLVLSVLLAGGSARAVPAIDGLYATLQTTMGDICFELYYTNVPQTVANFVSLAEGRRPWIDPRTMFISDEPYYNGLLFHRVVDGFMIQAGSPKADGKDGPGYTFRDEFDPALRHDRPGIVSMANSGFDSNGGQFFITVTNTSHLDDKHTVFGLVVEGMHVVSNIAAVATNAFSRPLEDITITNVFITRNGIGAQNFDVFGHFLPEVFPLPLTVSPNNGLHLSITTDTSSYQYVYRSTTLSNWTQAASGYWPEASDDWILPITSEAREFFRSARVVYPHDKNRTGNPVLHRFIIMIETDVVTIEPDGVHSGQVQVNSSTNAALTYWTWKVTPHQVTFIVDSDYYFRLGFELYYSSATNGLCNVYLYNYEWAYIGRGSFTDEKLNP